MLEELPKGTLDPSHRFVAIDFTLGEALETPESFTGIEYSILDPSFLATTSRSFDLSKDSVPALNLFVDTLTEDLDGVSATFLTDNGGNLRLKLISLAQSLSVQLPNWLLYPRYFDIKREFAKMGTAAGTANTTSATSTTSTASITTLTLTSMLDSIQLATDPSSKTASIASIAKHINENGGMTTPHDVNLDHTHFHNEKSRVLYMTNLPLDTTQSELEFWFTQFNTRPIAFWLVKVPFSQAANYCSGYVIFASHEDSTDALTMNGKVLNGCSIEIQPSSSSVLDKAHDLIAPFPSSKNKPRPGDWGCPSCGFSNFQRRVACFRCSFPAASAATVQGTSYNTGESSTPVPTPSSTPQPLPNYGKSMPTNGSTPTTSRSNSSVPFRAGDWNCLNNSCSYHNFAKNITCLKCGAPRVSMAVINGHPHHNQYDYSSRSNSLPHSQYKYHPHQQTFQPTPQSNINSNELYSSTSNTGIDLLNGNRSLMYNSSVPSTPTFQGMDYDIASRIGGLNLNSNTANGNFTFNAQ